MPVSDFEVTPTVYDNQKLTQTVLSDGDPLDLVRPPQGGFVSFVAARVRGLSDATVELRGRLLLGDREVTQEGRVVDLQRSSSEPDVWLPDLRSFTNVSNMPVCPHADTEDRMDRDYTLEVSVVEKKSGKRGVGRRKVATRCRQTDAFLLELCRCECAGGYYLGKCATTR
jgi:hypothetical protein